MIETFLLSMDNIGSQIVRLREEAETSTNHLTTLYGVAHHGINELKAAREGVLVERRKSWWDKHRADLLLDLLDQMDLILDSLGNMEICRRKALAHVVATSQILQTLDADVEELRARVTAPDVIGDKIPIEMHIKSIKAGADRLKERGAKAT